MQILLHVSRVIMGKAFTESSKVEKLRVLFEAGSDNQSRLNVHLELEDA